MATDSNLLPGPMGAQPGALPEDPAATSLLRFNPRLRDHGYRPQSPRNQAIAAALIQGDESPTQIAARIGTTVKAVEKVQAAVQSELQARDDEERAFARKLILRTFEKAEEIYRVASERTDAKSGTEDPDLKSMDMALGRMLECTAYLGNSTRDVGQNAIEEIRARSAKELKRMELDNPDRLVGGGFGGGIGSMPVPAVVINMPKALPADGSASPEPSRGLLPSVAQR